MAASANSRWQKGLVALSGTSPLQLVTAANGMVQPCSCPAQPAKLARGGKDKEQSLLGWSPEDEALACYQCALIAPETGIRTSPLFQKGVAIWSQRNVSGVGMSRRISTCMTAPTISRRRTWLARNDSSVSCVGTSRSLAAMALRVSLSRSTKWRRDDEPLEPQARRAFRSSRRPGLSIESIMADDVIAARSERARLRVGAWRSRSGVPSPSRCQPKIATCSNSRPTRTA
jgi:hypothetical protein